MGAFQLQRNGTNLIFLTCASSFVNTSSRHTALILKFVRGVKGVSNGPESLFAPMA